MMKSSAVCIGTIAECTETSKESEMTNGWPIQGSGEDFTKKLSLKWALMIGMDLKGGWRRKDIPSLQHEQRSRDGVLFIHRENHEQTS